MVTLNEGKLAKLIASWEREPVGSDDDKMRVVLAHEAQAECAMQLKALVMESANEVVKQIAPAQDAIAGVTHDIAQ